MFVLSMIALLALCDAAPATGRRHSIAADRRMFWVAFVVLVHVSFVFKRIQIGCGQLAAGS